MSRPGSIGWFAAHEARLAWRDWLSLMTGGRRGRAIGLLSGLVVLAFLLHGLAYLMFATAANFSGPVDRHVLVIVTASLAVAWSLMLSQAMESVTRAFYARGDLDLILTSPVLVSRLFAVRIAAIVVTVLIMVLALVAPFINVLAWFGGARWLGAYGVAVSLAMDATAIAVVLAVAMFRAIGPRRTRVVAQVVAAVFGATFAICVQFAAILSYGATPRPALAGWSVLERFAPHDASVLWWPARALLGEPAALAALLVLSAIALAVTMRVFAPHFGRLALAAASVSQGSAPRSRRRSRFRGASPARALRRKEWTLLVRDPWLMSQTLLQLLYLLPAGYLLWRTFYAGGGASALLVPILIIAAGQLGGGLAWLAVSGEDAPELIASAPVAGARVLRAKAEAVLGAIAAVFGPLVVMLAVAAPRAGLVACAGIAIAAGSATAIQFWFRTQARRSLFRRRQTSSRVANYAEALSSIVWAATGALAVTGTWLAVAPGIVAVAVLAGTWLVSPASLASRSSRPVTTRAG